jgi:hypothetical protein
MEVIMPTSKRRRRKGVVTAMGRIIGLHWSTLALS